jgi:hypothetical protein
LVRELLQEPGLADPGLSLDQDEMSLASSSVLYTVEEPSHLFLSADEGRPGKIQPRGGVRAAKLGVETLRPWRRGDSQISLQSGAAFVIDGADGRMVSGFYMGLHQSAIEFLIVGADFQSPLQELDRLPGMIQLAVAVRQSFKRSDVALVPLLAQRERPLGIAGIRQELILPFGDRFFVLLGGFLPRSSGLKVPAPAVMTREAQGIESDSLGVQPVSAVNMLYVTRAVATGKIRLQEPPQL